MEQGGERQSPTSGRAGGSGEPRSALETAPSRVTWHHCHRVSAAGVPPVSRTPRCRGAACRGSAGNPSNGLDLTGSRSHPHASPYGTKTSSACPEGSLPAGVQLRLIPSLYQPNMKIKNRGR